jgi:hypothetical protein
VIRPDGQPGAFNVVQVKAGVSVLALDQGGFVHLTEESRYGVGRQSTEVVSGAANPVRNRRPLPRES